MHIIQFLAFGDQHLSNQYYVVVSPLMMGLSIAGLLLPQWYCAWRQSKQGLIWIVGLQVLCVCGNYAYFLSQKFHDEDFATGMATLMQRLCLLQLSVVAISAIAAWFWLGRRKLSP